MMWTRLMSAGLLSMALALGTAGCEKEGPLEEAGEEIDDAVDDAADEIEDAVDN